MGAVLRWYFVQVVGVKLGRKERLESWRFGEGRMAPGRKAEGFYIHSVK
jgi:hypothetical protein